MKKLVFSISLTICTLSVLVAQEKVTVLTVNGYVNYFSGNSNIGKRLIPGDIVNPRGVIRSEKDALAVLLYKGRKLKLEAEQELDLTKMAKEKTSGTKMGYFGRFLSFIGSSVNNTEDNSKLEKHHQRYMSNAKGGIRGWGQSKADILTYKYLQGPIGGAEIQFQWEAKGNYQDYIFEIKEEESNTLFFKAIPSGNSLDVDLSQLKFTPEANYSWRIKALNEKGEAVSSAKILFSYEPAALSEFLADEGLERKMARVEEGEKPIVMVYELEQNGFLHATYNQYKELLQKSPENTLYKHLFAAFLSRMENLKAAKEVITN